MTRKRRRKHLSGQEPIFTQAHKECERRWSGKPGAIFICKDALSRLAKLMVANRSYVCAKFCGCKPKA